MQVRAIFLCGRQKLILKMAASVALAAEQELPEGATDARMVRGSGVDSFFGSRAASEQGLKENSRPTWRSPPMSNPCNFGTIVGHAASKPRFFENRAGGATVKLGIFARNSFVSKTTGEVESEVVELTGYIADVSTGHWVYDHINTGDRVAVSYSLNSEQGK